MWRCPLSSIGFDVTIIHSSKAHSTNITNDYNLLNNNEPCAHLRDLGEKTNIETPTSGTNSITGFAALTGDQAIGQILDGTIKHSSP